MPCVSIRPHEQIYVFVFSRCVQMIIPIWLICASFERWLKVQLTRHTCTAHPDPAQSAAHGHVSHECASSGAHRHLYAGAGGGDSQQGTLAAVSGCECSRCMAMATLTDAQSICNDTFRTFTIESDDSVTNFHIFSWFDHRLMYIQAGGPFLVLVLLNSTIIWRLHQTRYERQQTFGNATQLSLLRTMMPDVAARLEAQFNEDTVRVRSAVFTMVVIISSHLVSNLSACVFARRPIQGCSSSIHCPCPIFPNTHLFHLLLRGTPPLPFLIIVQSIQGWKLAIRIGSNNSKQSTNQQYLAIIAQSNR
jgi:hypothetical protein